MTAQTQTDFNNDIMLKFALRSTVTGKFGYLSDRGLIPLPEGMEKITLVK